MANSKQTMEEPLISIIVPIYNSEETISRCIDSLVEQTYKNIEIILVNDGSLDSSQAKCDIYAQKDSRVRVFHKENGGVSSARNLGIEKASGEFIIFVDSDDYLSMNTCEILLNHQLRCDSDCIIYGFQQLSGKIWSPQQNRCYQSLTDFKKDYVYWLNTELLSSSVNKLYKREKVQVLFPNRMSFGEDLIFSLSYLSSCEKISFITAPLYIHDNLNEKSLSHTFNTERFHDIEVIQKIILTFAVTEDKVGLFAKYVSDSVRIVRECLKMEDCSFAEKKKQLYTWLDSSYLKSIHLHLYSMNWKNRLMMFFFKNRFLLLSNIVVNGKRIYKNLIRKYGLFGSN